MEAPKWFDDTYYADRRALDDIKLDNIGTQITEQIHGERQQRQNSYSPHSYLILLHPDLSPDSIQYVKGVLYQGQCVTGNNKIANIKLVQELRGDLGSM